MKRQKQVKTPSLCLGIIAVLLLCFVSCDFQPAKVLSDNRPVGGKFAQGRPKLDEFIESGGAIGGGTTINTIQSGDKNNYPMLSKQAIKKLFDDTDTKYLPDQIMEEMPDWNPTTGEIWNPGKISDKALNLTLNRLNAIREICGLYPVILSDYPTVKKNSDSDETEKLPYRSAQYGAALMSLTKSLGHGGQPKPAGVDEKYYNLGVTATAGGDIYQMPPAKLIAAIDGYCLDPGNPGVGHRLTLLSPGQIQVDIGSVPAPSGSFASNVLQVYSLPSTDGLEIKTLKPDNFDWNFISYPSAGYFPLEGNLFGSPAFWHVQFNTGKYTVGSGKIIVTRLDSGEQWIEEHSGGGTIIFNKSNTWRPALGRYTYEVTGVRDKSTNIPVRFVFTTEFFDRNSL